MVKAVTGQKFGFNREMRCYELSPSKVTFWHRSRGLRNKHGDPTCECRTAADMVRSHVEGVFSVVEGENCWYVSGLSLDEGWTCDLFEVLSGSPGRRAPADRQWVY